MKLFQKMLLGLLLVVMLMSNGCVEQLRYNLNPFRSKKRAQVFHDTRRTMEGRPLSYHWSQEDLEKSRQELKEDERQFKQEKKRRMEDAWTRKVLRVEKGMTEKQVARIMGRPTMKEENTWIYADRPRDAKTETIRMIHIKFSDGIVESRDWKFLLPSSDSSPQKTDNLSDQEE